MKFKPTEDILNFLQPYADGMGVEVIEVEAKAVKNAYLTIYLDKEGGIDLDTLEKFHNLINDPLDAFDPYPAPYTLNVSSPGVDRPLKTERDFMRKMGKDVEVKLYASKKGKKFFEGQLIGYDGNTVTIKIKKEEIKFELSEIAKISEAVKFD